MRIGKFCEITGVTQPTARRYYDKTYGVSSTKHRDFTDEDVKYVMEHTFDYVKSNYGLCQVPTHPDYYVTETGDVYSTKFGLCKKLTVINRSGHDAVFLGSRKNRTFINVERLMADAFLSGTKDKVVIHKDGNLRNNTLGNLKLGTPAEKREVDYKAGNRRDMRGGKSPLAKKVVKVLLNGEILNTYDSISEAANAEGLHCGTVSSMAHRNTPLMLAGQPLKGYGAFTFVYESAINT